jgi:hypothetical protein
VRDLDVRSGVRGWRGEILLSREGRTRLKMGEIKKKIVKKKPTAKPKAPATAPRRPTRRKMVTEIRKQVEDRLAKDVKKASLTDYIRLVQLEKELSQTVAKETRATWVEPQEEEGEKEVSGTEK